MAETTYSFSISTDFLNGSVSPDRLTQEIRASAIVTALAHINTSSDDCDVVFRDVLSGGDETLLDDLVAAHSGEPLPSEPTVVQIDEPKTSEGFPITKVHTVEDEDGKQITVIYPATNGFRTFITGCADNGGPGNGAQIRLDFTEPDTKTVDYIFMKPIEVHDGELSWSPAPLSSQIRGETSVWSADDMFSVGLLMPATVAVANGSNTGNANKYDLGGGANMILPAAGDGAWDVDLETAVPVQAEKFVDGVLTKYGYWDSDYFSSEMSPSATPGAASFNMFDFPIEGWLLRNIGMGNNNGVLELDPYKTEWLSQRWKLRLTCTKVSAGAGTLSGWIMSFREPG